MATEHDVVKVRVREFLIMSGMIAVAILLIVGLVLAALVDSEGRTVLGLTQVECQQLGGEWEPPYHRAFPPSSQQSECFLEDAP